MRAQTIQEARAGATLEFLAKYCSVSWFGAIAVLVGLGFLARYLWNYLA